MQNDSISSLNFTLSSACGAQCVYCPRPRTRPLGTRFITPEIVEKVLLESREYSISNIDVGESGDAFLNPQALSILRLIRKHSEASIRVFSNFQTFSPEKIDVVLGERLLDKVIVNIDGATPETYCAVKGLDLKRVEEHIRYFLRKERELDTGISFRIQTLTLHQYVRAVRKALGRDPLYVPKNLLDTPDDFESIRLKWEAEGVVPVRSFVTFWAENERNAGASPLFSRAKDLRRRFFPPPCRMLPKIAESFFVAPSGKVYLCCADFEFQLIIGDVCRQTVGEILKSRRRREMITALRQRNFKKLGGPCLRSDLCRIY